MFVDRPRPAPTPEGSYVRANNSNGPYISPLRGESRSSPSTTNIQPLRDCMSAHRALTLECVSRWRISSGVG
jgi:hypothetical protein